MRDLRLWLAQNYGALLALVLAATARYRRFPSSTP